MNATRIGKIARLPHSLRDQLNRRLHDGEEQQHLVTWLNSLPETQTLLQAEFDARPITPQNLSEWKQGGYRDWLAHQEALDLVRQFATDTDQLQTTASHSLADKLALWLVSRYLLPTRALADSQDPADHQRLRHLTRDLVTLRRGDHAAQRLQLERDRLQLERDGLELNRQLTYEGQIKNFIKWSKQTRIRRQLLKAEQSESACIDAMLNLFRVEYYRNVVSTADAIDAELARSAARAEREKQRERPTPPAASSETASPLVPIEVDPTQSNAQPTISLPKLPTPKVPHLPRPPSPSLRRLPRFPS